MVVVMLVAVALLTVVVVMLVAMLLLKSLYRILKGVTLLYCRKDILAVKTVPRCGDDGSFRVLLPEKGYALGNFMLLCALGVGEDYSGGGGYLVVVELAKVLHIHFALVDVGNRCVGVEDGVGDARVLYGADNVGELAYSRGLDNYALGLVLLQHLDKRLGEIANEGATDAARIHLGYLDARIGEKSAVNAYLTEFVLNEDYALAGVGFLNKLFDKGGLSCSEKARKNVYFSHSVTLYCSPIFNTYFII